MPAQRREGEFAIGKSRNLRAIGGVCCVSWHAVDDGALHICDILHAEQCQLARRHLPNSFTFVHLIFPAALGIVGSSRRGRPAGTLSEPVFISTVRTRLSISGRTRSMWRSPLSRRAPLTSMPSARTKDRWNWRAA